MKSLSSLAFSLVLSFITLSDAFATLTISNTTTDDLLPQYIEAITSGTTNSTRLPFAFRVTVSGVPANNYIRFFPQVDTISVGVATRRNAGAGNVTFVKASGWVASSGVSFGGAPATNYDSVLVGSSGSFTQWYITVPTGNNRFLTTQLVALYNKIATKSDAAPNDSFYFYAQSSLTKLAFGTSVAANQGTGIWGVFPTGTSVKDFAFLYDNVAGTGRPLSGTMIEDDGAAIASDAAFYASNVDAHARAFGTIIPNVLASGVRRIEIRALSDGSIVRSFVDADGHWPSGVNTVNPTGGTTALSFGAADFVTALSVDAGGAIASGGTKDLGHVNISGANFDQTFTISNAGPASSSLAFPAITGTNASDFTYVGSNPTSISGFDGSVSASATFTVRFNPSGVGARSATLTFISLDGTNPTFTINLIGTGDEYSSTPINNPNPPQNAWIPPIPNDPTTNNQPPISIVFPAQGGAHQNPTSVTISHTTTPPAGINNYIHSSNNLIQKFWTITPSSENFRNATLTLYFTAADLPSGISNPVTASPPVYALYSTDGGTTWHPTIGVMSGPDGNGLYSYTMSNMNHFSQWGLGNDNVLPVELTSFTASAGDGSVSLQWRTETEVNNRVFRVYRSISHDDVGDIISEIPGHGNSVVPHSYQFTDHRVSNGTVYYYRIADLSSDGIEMINPMIVSAAPQRAVSSNVPNDYELRQNYPNPFNPTTEIQYGIVDAGHVDLTVFNSLGQVVAKLVDKDLQAGSYSVTFNGENLPNGVYFYRLENSNYSAVKKMLLLK